MKKKWIQRLAFISICLANAFTAWGQTNVEEKIKYNFRHNWIYPMEKVYLHFDNTSYFLGETVWYKAYVTTPDSTLFSEISKILHVELRNQFGQVVERQKVEIKKGAACGQIKLSPYNLPGYYEIRAYTKWMMNLGEQNHFSRVFPCYAVPEVPGEYKKELIKYRLSTSMKSRPKTVQIETGVDFYPEGGHLIKGIPAVIAFRFKTPEEPFPLLDSVNVYTSDDKLLTTTRTLHNGMGRFRYIASEKPGYIRFTYQNKTYKYKLPKAEEQGISLSIPQLSKDSILVRIEKNLPQADSLILCLAARGKLYRTAAISANRPLTRIRFPLHTLPCGVAQVLLFSQQEELIGRRMFFVNRPEKYIDIQCRQQKRIYAPGEKVSLQLQTSYTHRKACPTTLSLSVKTTQDTDLARQADNVRTNLLLCSELKGYIHRPEYYFLPAGKVREKELDLLMLVQGWNKYDYPPAIAFKANEPPHYLPEQSLFLEGQLKTNLFKKILPDTEVSIFLKDSIYPAIVNTCTDENGYFRLPLEGLKNRCPAILKAVNKKGKARRCRFVLHRNFTPGLRAYEEEEMLPLWDEPNVEDAMKIEKEEEKEWEKYRKQGILLDEVAIIRKRHKLPLKVYDHSISAYYDIEQLVEDHLDEGKKYVSLADLLISNDINFRWANNKDTNATNAPRQLLFYKGQPAWWVTDNEITGDEIAVNRLLMSKPQGLKTLVINEGSMADRYISEAIENKKLTFTEVMSETDKYDYYQKLLQGNGFNRVISITTAYGLDFFYRYPASPVMRVIKLDGITQPDEFYSPDYSSTPLPVEKDHRRTLYWNPSIETDCNGNASIEFYNAGKYTTLNIYAETISPDGKVGCLNTY